MIKCPIEFDDLKLLKFLTEGFDDASFLSGETQKYVLNIKQTLGKRSQKTLKKNGFKSIFNPSRKDSIDVLDFWERLIIDAIKYLKWHDSKEFTKPDEIGDKKNAYDKISEGSLGVYNLKDYFKAFIEFERLLYGAEQFYRDHVYHILKVWLIGQYIIKNIMDCDFPVSIVEDDEKLASNKFPCSAKNDGTLYAGEEDAIWCLIALTHDLGYPLSKVENINTSLRKMMQYYAKTGLEEFSFSFPQQNQFINDAILKYISSRIECIPRKNDLGNHYDTHIQAKFYLKFSRSFELFKHGLISCIVLVKNLIYFLETNFDHNPSTNLGDAEDARQFVIRREILRAIASHTCEEIYHFEPNSFSFILLLADEIQTWGRPTFEDMALGTDKQYTVTLNEFSYNRVSFTMKCNKKRGEKPISLLGLFKEKAELFKKILRVAVDTSQRQFTFDFSIIDELDEKYEFIARPRDRAEMRINGSEIEHRDLQKLVEIHKKNIFDFKKTTTKYITKFKLKKRS
ncbi:MAG: hypothetical protein WC769_00070 [Thermodesulfovibrionales bacterium]|jgi:hypothetical protein